MNQQELDQLTIEMNTFMEREGGKLFPPSKSDELAELGAKRCSKCSTVKTIEEFSKDTSRRDGLDSKCKACDSAKAASYREANPEYMSKWLEANPEYMSKWRVDNPEYHHNRYNDPEDNYRLTMQLNRGYHRATKAGVLADRITPEDLLTHWESIGLDPWTCYLTGDPLDHLTRSIDHIVAIGNGGEHTVENLAPCTFEANKKKNTATAEEARELLSA